MMKFFRGLLCALSVFTMGNISNATAATIEMVEFYLPNLDYYFITSRLPEIAALDAAPDWLRTGKSFGVLSEATNGTSPITRFFFPEVASSQRADHISIRFQIVIAPPCGG